MYPEKPAGKQTLQASLNMTRILTLCVSLLISPLVAGLTHADMTDILVYKGELRFVAPAGEARDSLLIQFRTKTRDVLRVAVDHLSVTNTDTREFVRLPRQTATLVNNIDSEGYWTTDILYDGLEMGNDSLRVEGNVTLFLAGSQRTRHFSVYLRPEPTYQSFGSSIDWGVVD